MSDTYTPTTEQVRRFWTTDGTHVPAAKSDDDIKAAAEFDRWLAAHDADTREQCAREVEAAVEEWPNREDYSQGARDGLTLAARLIREGRPR